MSRKMTCKPWVSMCSVVMALVACYADVPSKSEFAAANEVVTDILAPKIDEMKAGKVKPMEVADYALSLMGEAETPAAKYMLAGNAYAYYMKGGEYAKAVEAIGMMREAIPDIPADRLLKAISPAAKGVSATKAPEVHAILADLQGKVQSQGEITKLAAQIKGAKVSERPVLYRKLGESYAVIGDWKQALENLSKGDGDVANVAQDEMDNTKSVGKLAGMWWDASEEKGIKPAVSSAYRKHAAELYQKGLDDGSISGLNKKLAEQRIETANATTVLAELPIGAKDMYCVVDLSSGPDSKRYPVSYLSEVPADGWTDEYKTTKLVLRKIEAGKFDYIGGVRVKIDKPYYIGVFEVTQKQYELVCGYNPSRHKGSTRPVEMISYERIRGKEKGLLWPKSNQVDDNTFLGRMRKRSSMKFDLPTEIMWEYACRAGTSSKFSNGSDDKSSMGKLGMCIDTNGVKTHHLPVGSRSPNAWGLYDMHGNLWEYCLDREIRLGWKANNADTVRIANKKTNGPDMGNQYVKRGGSWLNWAADCSSFTRFAEKPNSPQDYNGFRVAIPPPDRSIVFE